MRDKKGFKRKKQVLSNTKFKKNNLSFKRYKFERKNLVLIDIRIGKEKLKFQLKYNLIKEMKNK